MTGVTRDPYSWEDTVERMVDAGRAYQISDDRCIEDWCVVHWATEVMP